MSVSGWLTNQTAPNHCLTGRERLTEASVWLVSVHGCSTVSHRLPYSPSRTVRCISKLLLWGATYRWQSLIVHTGLERWTLYQPRHALAQEEYVLHGEACWFIFSLFSFFFPPFVVPPFGFFSVTDTAPNVTRTSRRIGVYHLIIFLQSHDEEKSKSQGTCNCLMVHRRDKKGNGAQTYRKGEKTWWSTKKMQIQKTKSQFMKAIPLPLLSLWLNNPLPKEEWDFTDCFPIPWNTFVSALFFSWVFGH